MENNKHILKELGILDSFYIARSLTGKELIKLESQSKKKNISWNKFIVDHTDKLVKKAFKNNKVPGIIPNPPMEIEKINLIALSGLSDKIATHLKKNKADKYHCCYVINCICKLLDLSEKDFDEFQKRFDKFHKDNGDEGEAGAEEAGV